MSCSLKRKRFQPHIDVLTNNNNNNKLFNVVIMGDQN